MVNPTAHLHGLPVAVVNEDAGGKVGSQPVDFGQQLAAGLIHSPALSSRLALRPSTLGEAGNEMDVGKEFAAIVIPPGFTVSLLSVAGVPPPSSQTASRARSADGRPCWRNG